MHPLTWPDCRNVRDLAGLPTAAGELQTGRLVRSDNLDQLTPAGLAAVEAAQISRFVDLRSAWERETFPSPYVGDARVRNVPLWDPGDPDVSTLELFEQYRTLVDDYRELVASDYADSVASAETILRLLAHVEEQYGGTAAYLLEAGATTDQLDALVGRLTG